MSVTAQKYLVASLSLALAAALGVVGVVEGHMRSKLPWANAPGPLDPQVDRGRQVYEKYSCIACHGPGGVGGINNVNAQTGGKINGLKFVAESYTKQDLAKKVLDGVPVVEKADPNGPQPPLAMPAYRGIIGSQELEDLTKYLFSLQPAAPKSKGEEW
jgi:mono/diheme cytochrome c family protein